LSGTYLPTNRSSEGYTAGGDLLQVGRRYHHCLSITTQSRLMLASNLKVNQM
jgi:hypothetical protein